MYSIEEIASALKGKKKIFIFTHNNPDPDAIAAAWAVQYLLKESLKIKSKIVYDGFIGRAENKAMVKLLKIKLFHLSNIKFSNKSGFILVDTQPGFGNNSLPSQIIPSLVIDHHPLKKQQKSVLIDVRKDVGSTASILTEYLVTNNLEIPKNLATALFYGIESETQGLSIETDNLDRQYYKLLFPKISQFLLGKIQYPRLEKEFFLNLRKALNNVYFYKNVMIVNVGRVDNPDLVSEFCTFFLLYEKASWALSVGGVGNRLFFSIRTQNRRANAGRIARKISGMKGSGGGHETSAGGWIDISPQDKLETITQDFIKKFLIQLGYKEDVFLTPFISTE
ncbi:MAG: DHH family phosphoesterase [Candidatus Ratteibacteria bacterium]|nr:DHH family phosphoesterase [Candidatus Ratteibacteria bacterium]